MSMPEPAPIERQRELALGIVEKLRHRGFQALWAGGCVRDLLLNRPTADYDVATSATPQQVRSVFGSHCAFEVGATFGVVMVSGARGVRPVEVATFRTDGPYLDGRHPSHVGFATAEQDALRRDFTMNGMFFDPLSAAVLDYVGGQADLQRRVVRAIGKPHDRIREDKLRMLRAVRMAARFDFTLDEATRAAIREMAPEVLVVSQERIAQELKKMLGHDRRDEAVRLMRDAELLPRVLPELEELYVPTASPDTWQATLDVLRRLTAPSFELAFAAMFVLIRSPLALSGRNPSPPEGAMNPGAAQAAVLAGQAALRLRLSNAESERIHWLVGHRAALMQASQLPLATLKRILGPEPERVRELMQLHRARSEVLEESLAECDFCEQFVRNTPRERLCPDPLVTGEDLIALGLKPGPNFKTWLHDVYEAQLAERFDSKAAALHYVAELPDAQKHDI